MAENEGKGEVRRVLGRSFTNSGNEQPDNSNIEKQQVQPNTTSQTEQNNAGNEKHLNDENIDEYIFQILDSNIPKNEKDGFNISDRFNTDTNQVQGAAQSSDSTSGIIVFLMQHIQEVVVVVFVLLIVCILANLEEEPSSTTYTPNVTEQEQIKPNYDNVNNTIPAPTKQDVKQETIPPTATQEKPVVKVQSEPVKKAEPAKSQSAPTSQYTDPNMYLAQVQRQLQISFNQYGNSASVDCSMLVEPSGSIKKLKDDWNADVAYNFLSLNRSKIPKFVDKQGNAIPLIVNFSGHSISVKFQYPPKMTTAAPVPAKNSSTVNKSDLQKSQDWFFE